MPVVDHLHCWVRAVYAARFYLTQCPALLARGRAYAGSSRSAAPQMRTRQTSQWQEIGVAHSSTIPRSATTPPKSVAAAAARGLRLRERHGRGGTAIGVARARDLSAQTSLSAQTIGRMRSYFARHNVDKNGKGWADAKAPSAGYIAWLLWGGDAGQRWAARLYARLQGASAKQGASSADGSKKNVVKKAAAKKSATKKAVAKEVALKKSVKKAAAKKATTTKRATKKAAAGSTRARKTPSSTVARKASKKAATTSSATKKINATKKAPAKRSAGKKSTSTASAAKKRATKTSAPWNTPSPKSASRSKPLSPAQKTQARKRANAAGRHYPNLVDNMAVASKRSTTKRAAKSSATNKRAAKK